MVLSHQTGVRIPVALPSLLLRSARTPDASTGSSRRRRRSKPEHPPVGETSHSRPTPHRRARLVRERRMRGRQQLPDRARPEHPLLSRNHSGLLWGLDVPGCADLQGGCGDRPRVHEPGGPSARPRLAHLGRVLAALRRRLSSGGRQPLASLHGVPRPRLAGRGEPSPEGGARDLPRVGAGFFEQPGAPADPPGRRRLGTAVRGGRALERRAAPDPGHRASSRGRALPARAG